MKETTSSTSFDATFLPLVLHLFFFIFAFIPWVEAFVTARFSELCNYVTITMRCSWINIRQSSTTRMP